MKSVVLLGTAHSIQRGENDPDAFRAALMGVLDKHKVKAIAEEADNGISTVASELAESLDVRHLYADPDNNERVERGIESDCRLDIVRKHEDRYPQVKMWPCEPSAQNLPAEVWKEYSERTAHAYRMREQIWFEKIKFFDVWPLLFICGANHFNEFSKLLKTNRVHVVESHRDWMP